MPLLLVPAIYVFLLVLSTTLVVDSISTCHTKVYMKGDNDFVLFHVEEEELIEPIASQFCVKHLVDSTECQRIIQYHKEHCFQEKNETTTVSTSSENEEQRVDEVMFQTQTIDYAEKTGPILQIFRVDGTLRVTIPPPQYSLLLTTYTHLSYPHPITCMYYHQTNLQAVAGETKEQSIIRFCGMLNMNDNDCRQVAEKYEQLLKEQQAVLDGENNQQQMNDGNFQGNVDTTEPHLLRTEQPNDLITYWNHIVQQARDMLNYWWKWILLVVAIYYCYLIQQPQLFRDGGWED